MTSREDVALQLTLSSLDTLTRNARPNNGNIADNNKLATSIVEFYNHIYNNIKNNEPADSDV